MSASSTDLDRALWALRGYDVTALATVGPSGPHVAGVFFAPERHGEGIRLLLALLRDSRKHHELVADPRVAFMCSPGNPSRWVQGEGRARVVDDDGDLRFAMYQRILEHAPGARTFIEDLPVVPVVVDVTHLKVVEDVSRPPFVLTLAPPAEAA